MTVSQTPGRGAHVALLVALVIIWAASWPIIRIAMGHVPPVWFGVMRYGIACALVFPAVWMSGGRRLPPTQDWTLILVSGVLQMGAYAALMAFALVTLPPGRASVIAYSTPLWVVPLAALWLGERMTLRNTGGVILGMAGLAVIAAPSVALRDVSAQGAYLALVGASLSWALTIVFVRSHTFRASAFELAPWQMLIAAVVLVPIALVLEGPPPSLSRTALVTLAFVGPISTAFAYWAAVEVGRHVRAGTMSMSLLATPCLGIVISAITLGESVDGWLLIGLVLVALGIIVTLIQPHGRVLRSEAKPADPDGSARKPVWHRR